MKKAFLTKIMSAVISVVTITALLPLKASAEWKNNSDKTWSYMNEDMRVKGWKSVLEMWYYFNSNGIMQTGWISDKGNWYYLDNSGAMKTWWVYDNGNWYYANGSGVMQTGWVRDRGKWYYMDNHGVMKTGFVHIDDRIYYFNESGEMQQTRNDSGREGAGNGNDTTNSGAVDVNGLPKLPDNYSISVQDYAENKILELMNQKRVEAGLTPLTMDNTLLQIARYKSNHMIQYNYFDHTTPEGENWASWLDTISYQYTKTGENIAYNNYDPVKLFDQWWNSPGHKANMMEPSYSKVGIGVINGDGKYMGTQDFSN